MPSITTIESSVLILAQATPLEAFVFVGSIVEEIVSPIPSTLIMGVAGAVSGAASMSGWYLALLALIGGAGKLVGALVYYLLGDKAEDFIVPRVGRYFGVTHRQLESIGSRFAGSWKDVLVLAALRALPFAPSLPISIASGVVKVPMRTFVVGTFVGNFLKDLLYLLIGYLGIEVVRRFFREVIAIRTYVDILVGIGLVGLLILLYVHRRRGVWLWESGRDLLRRWRMRMPR